MAIDADDIKIVNRSLEYATVVGIDIVGIKSGNIKKRTLAYNSKEKHYSIVGGHSKEKETSLEAAMREFREETGRNMPYHKLKPVDWHLRHPNGATAQPFIAYNPPDPTVQKNDEITKFIKLSNRELWPFMEKNRFEPFSEKYYKTVLKIWLC